MANRFYTPDEQFCDATGTPYANGFLYFYASGTSTPLNTYADSALTIANLNPIVLDSAGRAGSIFLQNLAYKVVLQDVNNVQIWTEDPVYTSDYSTVAQFTTYPGNPNGKVAGTAGSGSVPSSVVWDSVDQELFVCTQTGTILTAVWTNVAPASSTGSAGFSVPQGYLTPTSGVPVITGDVTSATAVYYTPTTGNSIPIYNGTNTISATFSELTLNLTSASNSSNTIYDVFVFNNSGVITAGTGPAWTNSAAGTGARGTGAGTTQLTRVNGILVNAVSITLNNSTNSYSVAANQATYVGSIYIDSSAGQVSCYRSWGQGRKWGVWNAYNRVPIILQAGDSTASWSYGTNTYRPSNNATANSFTTFTGLAEEMLSLTFTQQTEQTAGGSATQAIAVGFNSTSAASGTVAFTESVSGAFLTLSAWYDAPPSLGINTVTSLEKSSSATTFFGTQPNMYLRGYYRG